MEKKEIFQEFIEELRFFERLMDEVEIESQRGRDPLLYYKRHIWTRSYLKCLQDLFDVCSKLGREKDSNVSHIIVYQMRQQAWDLMRLLYLKLT